MAKERDIERYLCHRVKALGGQCLKWTSPGRRGVPDRLVFLPMGLFCAVELKAPGESCRAEQLREHNRLRALDVTVLVISSYEDVDLAFPA